MRVSWGVLLPSLVLAGVCGGTQQIVAAEFNLDGFMAGELTMSMQKMVVFDRIAAACSQNDQIREYATEMIVSQTQAIEALRPFIPDSARGTAETRSADENGKTSTDSIGDSSQTNLQSPPFDSEAGAAANDTAFKQASKFTQTAERNFLKLAKSELQRHHGQDLDKVYTEMQTTEQMRLESVLQAAAELGSPQLREIVRKQLGNAEPALSRLREVQLK